VGDPTFFYKDGDPAVARKLSSVVYDVVNDHFETRPSYREMCYLADAITCASEWMQERIQGITGKVARVIDDPYENKEWMPAVAGEDVLWFGHSANLSSIRPYTDLITTVCSNVPWAVQWTREAEDECLAKSAVVVMTGNNPGASSNRVAKAIRSGRYVVSSGGVPAWDQFKPYMWIGDIRKGVEWAKQNREEACSQIAAGQRYVRTTFCPRLIASQWAGLFGSTLEQATKKSLVGLA
jgi:hypothetical protein